MNRKIYSSVTALSLLAVCAGVSSCVDKDYRIDEVDLEVQLAAEGVSLPLVTIESKTLGDLFDEKTLDGHMTVGPDGYYKLGYASDGDIEPIVIEGIEIQNVGDEIRNALADIQPIRSDVPDFEFEGDDVEIEEINLHSSASAFPNGLQVGVPVVAGLEFEGSVSSNNARIGLDVTLPDELTSIQTVYLGETEAGSLVSMTFDIADLEAVTRSLVLDIEVELPERYTLGEYSNYGGKASIDGNKFTLTNYTVPDISDFSVQFYIKEIDLSEFNLAQSHTIIENEPFIYRADYTLTTKAGTISGSVKPSVTVTGAPAFRDADFEIDQISVNKAAEPISLDAIQIALPATVNSLSLVSVDMDCRMTVRLNEFNLPFKETSPAPGVKISFPSVFVINPEEPSQWNAAEHTLFIPLSSLLDADGYMLDITGLNWEGDSGAVNDGKVEFMEDIDVEFVGELKTELNWERDIRDIIIPTLLEVDVDMVGDIALTEIAVKLDARVEDNNIETIDLSNITKELGDSEITADLLPPMLALTIDNPTGVTVEGEITLDPKNSAGNTILAAPVVVDVTVGPGANKLFIAGSDAGMPAGYTWMEADLKDLLMELPDTLGISFAATTDPTAVQTIPLGGGDMVFTIEYAVDMPLGFGPDMAITLRRTEDLGDTFKNLAEMKVKAADISVSLELEATFPLKIADIELKLLDGQGGTISGLDTYVQGSIDGAAPGAQPRKSTLTIGIKVPRGGDFTTLSSIKQLEFTLPIRPAGTGAGDMNRLSPDDHIKGRAWITLPKGIGLDIDEL